MNYRVIKSTKEPSVTSYYMKDNNDKDYKLVMWDSGMFRIFNEEGEQEEQSSEENIDSSDLKSIVKKELAAENNL